jgi:glycosyltransferase involved in cell wall biosynthesis
VSEPGVALVITCFNLGRQLREALSSATSQTQQPSEILIVDDGSDDVLTRQVLAELEREGQHVVRTLNKGVSAARNLGISLTTSPLIVLLDADDVLDPSYLKKAADRLIGEADLSFVSCGMKGFGASEYTWSPTEPELIESMTRGVPHISSMFRRSIWKAVGGFDETLEAFEELDFWTTVLEHGFRGAVLPEPLLRYRVRQDSLYHRAIAPGAHARLMNRFYLKHASTIAARLEDILMAKEAFILEQRAHYDQLREQHHALECELADLNSQIGEATARLRERGQDRVQWGNLRRTDALSPTWGMDRGRPLDRYYIDGFLEKHQTDISGRVLEVNDDGYTQMFGGDCVTYSDVLDVRPHNERATIVADLARADSIPSDTYDCFILTQTLMLIYDVSAALFHARRILKPDGVLLCTVAATGRIAHEDRGVDGDYWRFTEGSLRRLFAEHFAPDDFAVTSYGNVLASVAFQYGMAAHELTPDELDVLDPYFPVTYGIRAVKRANPRQ